MGDPKSRKIRPDTPAPVGHNKPPKVSGQDILRSYVNRIEKLNEDRAAIGADIRDVLAEAKGQGFDAKGIRRLVALRKLSADERAEQQAIDETYQRAMGMIFGTDED